MENNCTTLKVPESQTKLKSIPLSLRLSGKIVSPPIMAQ